MLPITTTCPFPDASRTGRRALVTRTVPRTFTSNIHRHSSTPAVAMGSRPSAPPALFTSTRASGIVAWTGVGIAALIWAAHRLLSRAAGVLPFLVTAGLVVLVLNPAVTRLAILGIPRRVAAIVVSLAALALAGLVLAFMVPLLAH